MNLSKRLNAAMLGGNLTVMDLSRWLDRSYPTVSGWVKGRTPRGADGDMAAVIDKLKVIEKRIRLKKGLPVPHFPNSKAVRRDTARIMYLTRLMARKKM